MTIAPLHRPAILRLSTTPSLALVSGAALVPWYAAACSAMPSNSKAMDIQVRPPVRLLIEAQHIASRITKPSSDLGRIWPDRLNDLAAMRDEGINRFGHYP